MDVVVKRDEMQVEVKTVKDGKEQTLANFTVQYAELGRSVLSFLSRKLPSWIGIRTNAPKM